MFHSDLKNEALRDMKQAQRAYKETYEETAASLVALYEAKMAGNTALEAVEKLVNSIAKTPKSFRGDVEVMKMERRQFSREVTRLSEEADDTSDIAAGGGVGALAGGTVALAGPTLAMAAATTFGTHGQSERRSV